MARDYKNAGTKPKPQKRPVRSWVSFVSGLMIGLLIALSVYLSGHRLPQPGGPRTPAMSAYESGAMDPEFAFEEEIDRGVPEREFDFYKILPEIEVKVPDWEISSTKPDDDDAFDTGTYVLQVGSFKQHADADRAKAQLALRGIQAKIHRVVINGQDVWYRVHVGPYSDVESIRAMRARLIESGNDYILLKIGGESAG